MSTAPNLPPGHAYCSEDECFNLVPDSKGEKTCLDCSFRMPYAIQGRVVVALSGRLISTRADRRITKERLLSILYRYISKARVSGLDLFLDRLEHLEQLRGPDGTPAPPAVGIPITWFQCDPECPGWLHQEDPRAVEACDECERFQCDEDARYGHEIECGCAWPAENET